MSRKLDPYTLMAMFRKLWRHGVAQRKLGAFQYAQGIFSAASRCRDEARAIERKAKPATPGKRKR